MGVALSYEELLPLGLSLALNWRIVGRRQPQIVPERGRAEAHARAVRPSRALVSAVPRQLSPHSRSQHHRLPGRPSRLRTRQFIANLRVAGCPEQTIRDIVLVRMSRAFSAGCWISRRSNAGIELLAGP